MKHSITVFLSSLYFLLATGTCSYASSTPNLISNGDLETFTGTFSSGYSRLYTGNGNLTDWAVGGGSVDLLSPSFSNFDDGGHGNVLELSGNVGHYGYIEQTFSTVAGATYQVAFDMNGSTYNSYNHNHNMRVSADGFSADFSHTDTDHTSWDHYLWAFTADSDEATLRFQDLNGVGYTGSIVDNIVVTVSSVPLPAAVWLFGSAMAGLGFITRKRKKAA